MDKSAHELHDRIVGCLIGSAVGDAMGGPVEGLSYAEIMEKHGVVDGMMPYPPRVPPSFHGPFGGRAGDYTDDTRLAKLICTGLVASGASPKVGDLDRSICKAYYSAGSVLARGFLEEYTLKSHYGSGKEAFGGRTTNGAIMAIAPVGVLYPGDPHRTFDAAFEVLSMATGSARISAAVAAACISVALTGRGTALDVVSLGLMAADERLHRIEGNYWRQSSMYPRVGGWSLELSRKAIEMASAIGDPLDSGFRKRLLNEIAQPFFADGDDTLAIALAMFVAADGGFRSSVLGAVNFGKDCDSYAAVAGALAGAFNGCSSIPSDWIEAVERCEEPPRLQDLADSLCASVASRIRRERNAADLVPFMRGRSGAISMSPEAGFPAVTEIAKIGLLAAARDGDGSAIARLRTEGADPGERGDLGRTALHLSCAAGHLDIVRSLLLFGADINVKDTNKTTALHFAAWENHIDIVDLLLEWGIFPEEEEGKGWTALHDSVRKEFADIPLRILAKSRGLTGEQDRKTALEAATGETRFLMLLELLSEFHINLGAIGICGHGLLHDAKKRAYSLAVDYLKVKGVADEP
ncbi:MAG: ADP-ribosylglycohydrolase family protein [Spirochaetota bacterium]